VIHAAVMATDLVTDADKIGIATRSSLQRAEELGLKSIAFPALGTGVGRFPYGKVAEIMIDEVSDHLARGSGLEEVIFALFGDEAFEAFENRLEQQGHSRGNPE
jgi:O-acetyl-ADP-ribose deacetylase (regulator of RNase III)